MEDKQATLYEWEADEFVPPQRDRNWYIWAGLVFILLLVWFIWTRQWASLAVLVMVGVLLILMNRLQPRRYRHQLAERGVAVGEKLYPYSQLRNFWIVDKPEARKLYLTQTKKLGAVLTLQLESADVEKVRDVLSSYLPENSEGGEDIVDKMSRFLRF